MKNKIAAVVFVAALSGAAYGGGFGLEAVRLANLPAVAEVAPQANTVPAGSPAQILSLGLLAQAGGSMLYSVPGSSAAFAAFRDFWTPVLEKAGFKGITAEYASGLAKLKYAGEAGRVVRMFLCDTRRMPLSPAEIGKKLSADLEAAGMRVIGVFSAPEDQDVFPAPTVAVYYTAVYEENPDHETQLRYLSSPSSVVKLDLPLLESSGARVTAAYGENSVFYIGRRIGLISGSAKDLQTAASQIERYKRAVAAASGTYLSAKVDGLEHQDPVTGERFGYVSKVYYLW